MALRRTLSLRSLFTARSYQPSFSSIIRSEEKPNYRSFLHQRFFSSSILSQHLRSCSQVSQGTPFGVSVCWSMSTSHAHGSHVKKDSLLQDVALETTTLTKVVDAAQKLVDRVHSFTGLNWFYHKVERDGTMVYQELHDLVPCLYVLASLVRSRAEAAASS